MARLIKQKRGTISQPFQNSILGLECAIYSVLFMMDNKKYVMVWYYLMKKAHFELNIVFVMAYLAIM